MERNKLYLTVFVVIVIAAAALFLVAGLTKKGNSGLVAYDNLPVSQAVLSQLQVPNSVANGVGIGAATYLKVIQPISGAPPLEANGKPEILYMGAEYCPYCAAQRWALIIALMRFGNFSNLHYMTSSATDYSQSTATFTFYNSTYTSSYLTFVPVELEKNTEVNNTYPVLQIPTTQQQKLMSTYDPGGSVPFVDFANLSSLVGSTYDPYSTIYGENWTTIAGKLDNTSTIESEAIVGSANLMTAEICMATNNTPKSVCGQPYVTQIKALLSKSG